jgi:hypothetical protein
MSTYAPGQQLLVTDPDHPMYGMVGQFDFAGVNMHFIVVNGRVWPVNKNMVQPAPKLEVAA